MAKKKSPRKLKKGKKLVETKPLAVDAYLMHK